MTVPGPLRRLRWAPQRSVDVARLGLGAARQALGVPVRSRKIFVIGTGRSGTHWLGDILGGHRDIHVTVEKPPIFPWVTEMALDPGRRAALLPRLLRRYRLEHAAVTPRHYADKSHPNLWIAEALAEAFPEARFVGIRRDVFGTVASMLKHEGVQRWIHGWRRYPVPNSFLGIDQDEAERYESRSLAGRCALRWRSHMEELERLRDRLGSRLLLIDYDRLQNHTADELKRLTGFLDLATPIPMPPIRRDSLGRWRTELGPQDIAEIRAVAGSLAAPEPAGV